MASFEGVVDMLAKVGLDAVPYKCLQFLENQYRKGLMLCYGLGY